ncbi:MAG: penicillin-binding protein 2 [Candidatus Elulimicrobiales bacterium]|nr:penicillin-binding protein 2 [Candidatus Elulimicrobiales bacterium]
MSERNKLIHNRINIFVLVIFFIFALIIARLFYLQIIHGAEYKRAGESQYFYDTGENFDRGSIFFTNKKGTFSPAVAMSNEYDLALDPKTINLFFEKRIEEGLNLSELENDYFSKISKVFEDYNSKIVEGASSSSKIVSFLDKDSFLEKMHQKDSGYEILLKNVPEEIANELVSLRMKGLIVSRKKSRVYFEKDIGAKVFGFVGFSEDKKTGLYGLERYYNDVLDKKNIVNSNFFAEVFSDFNSSDIENKDTSRMLQHASSEGDINLTIDANVQRYVAKLLGDAKARWNSQKIGAIVMDINDGSILAMEEIPTFDPNNYREVSDISVYNNDLVSGVYEMGSIIKPLTVAVALDMGLVNESTTYNDTGSIVLNGYRVSNYDKVARGPNTPLQKILSDSLNVGIAFLVEKIGGSNLSEYFHKFGFGEYTGIDLPSEASGLVSNLDSKVAVDLVTAGFGQGIATTPIQTIRALAVLGNGGKLVTPHVVESISYDNGTTKVIVQDEPINVFQSTSTSERISKILTRVVDEAMNAKNPHYTVAAKTGTAQVSNPNTGKYYEDKYLHSFFGYFPATNPKYIIFLYQVDPRGAQYASQTLKESFFSLVNYLISYYEIPPDR